jgi:ribose 1,5-bisphosphokinase
MAGILALVVGPSGAGKDTLIASARAALAGDPSVVFPRRLVTRTALPHLEDHDTLSWSEFEAGDFALSWRAHGLGYAVPRGIETDLTAGRVVVVNVSRRVLEEAARRYPMHVLVVTATAEVRAKRLAARGREDAAAIAGRLAREGLEVPPSLAPVTVIDNSGALATAEAAFIAAIRALAGSG